MFKILRPLLISLLITANLIQPAVLMYYRNDVTYNNYVRLAEDELDNIKANLPSEGIAWTGIGYYAKELYYRQKTFLKALLRCIKDTKDDNNFFRQFESEIYKQWKHDFKRNYKNSLSIGDWSWVHRRFYFVRWE